MIRIFVTTVALALALPAYAAEQEPQTPPAKRAEKSTAPKAKQAGKAAEKTKTAEKPATGSTKPKAVAAKEEAASKKAHLEQLRVLGKKKSRFMVALETCARPERCDKEFLLGSEKSFVDACEECSTPEKCDAERAAIREGAGTSGPSPCE